MDPGRFEQESAARPTPAPASSGAPPSKRLLLGLFLLLFAIYNSNLREIAQGDSYSSRYVPLALLHFGTFSLTGFRDLVLGGRPDAYWLRDLPDGHSYSTYPLVTPLLVTPAYLPAAAWLSSVDWRTDSVERVARLMEKVAASGLTAFSVTALFSLLATRMRRRPALLLTLAYGLGTGAWPISSQALWQHAMSQTLLILVMHFAVAESTGGRRILSGAAIGLLAANRIPDLPIAVALLIWNLVRGPRRPAGILFGAALGWAPFLLLNLLHFGSPAGGYSAFSHNPASLGIFQGWSAPLAMLFSPGKGLLFFSPFLLLLLLPRGPGAEVLPRGLSRALWGAFGAQLLLFSFTDWDGGSCYGPRFLLDILPFFAVALAPRIDSASRSVRLVATVLVALSIAIQAVGAFQYRSKSNAALRVHRLGPVPDDPVWKLGLWPPGIEAREPLAKMKFLDDLRAELSAHDRGSNGAGEDQRK